MGYAKKRIREGLGGLRYSSRRAGIHTTFVGSSTI